MLNAIWLFFFISAFLAACVQLALGDVTIFTTLVTALFDMAKLAFDISLGLVGVLCFWMGILKIGEAAGLIHWLSRCLSPLFRRLMPDVPSNHPAFGHISMNLAANMLGLDNAATPVGIKAMKSLQSINPSQDTASNAQILFLVLNTSAVTLFPVTIIMYRLQQGAVAPAEIFVPILIATAASTLAGLTAVAWCQGLKLWDRVIGMYAGGAALLLGGFIFMLARLPSDQLSTLSTLIGNGALFSLIIAFMVSASIKRVNVYEHFIEGAKEGFNIALTILPYLLAMLVAIGVFRASGLMDFTVAGLRWVFEALHMNTAFVDALPTALMKPLSGSGSRALMLELMHSQGVDSFAAKVAATIQGSTETTFYVLAVYFGAVGIQKIRHALACGLVADAAGIITAIAVGYWFFG